MAAAGLRPGSKAWRDAWLKVFGETHGGMSPREFNARWDGGGWRQAFRNEHGGLGVQRYNLAMDAGGALADAVRNLDPQAIAFLRSRGLRDLRSNLAKLGEQFAANPEPQGRLRGPGVVPRERGRDDFRALVTALRADDPDAKAFVTGLQNEDPNTLAFVDELRRRMAA